MKIKLLKPRLPVFPELPQCSARVRPPGWAPNWRTDRYEASGKDPTCCQRNATVELNGKPYCRLHGGSIALDILLKLEDK